MADQAERAHERDNQATQQQLLEQAKQEPTVAQALAAYEAIRAYIPQPANGVPPRVRYSTGANS